MNKNNINNFISTYKSVEGKMKKIAKAIKFPGTYTSINFNKYGVLYSSTVYNLGNDTDGYCFVVLWSEIRKHLTYFVKSYKSKEDVCWVKRNKRIYWEDPKF